MKAYLISLCKVYKGERINPVDKDKDEFKAYMWERERAAIELSAYQDLKDKDSGEEFFKQEIKAAIDLYAGTPYGADPSDYYKKYFAL